MGLKSVPSKRKPADRLFLAQYRQHVGSAEACGCNFDGPARDCDRGYSLWKAAHPIDWGNPAWATF